MRLVRKIYSYFLIGISFSSCGIKTETYYDVWNKEKTSYGNEFPLEDSITVTPTFGFYAYPNAIGYGGIWLELAIQKDSLATIQFVDVEIKPSRSGTFIRPSEYQFSSISPSILTVTGKSFAEVCDSIPKTRQLSLNLTFPVNVGLYDSLLAKYSFVYTKDGQSKAGSIERTYYKSYYYAPYLR